MSTPPASSLSRSLLVGAPRPLLSLRAESALGQRHREILDGLETLLRNGELAPLTIGELAAKLECSRRTLYELAPSKEQLFLLTLDRFMHRIGREAISSVDSTASATTQLRQYATANLGYAFQSSAYDDLTDVPGAQRLIDRHHRFGATVIERVIALGIDQGEFRPIDPKVAAAVIRAAVVFLAQPDVSADFGGDLDTTIAEVLDLCLKGLLAR
jgi:AcrR family transcriptional regulator